MKQNYNIHGMTCNGCRAHVEETLSKVDGVLLATVNLEKEEATIKMETHIPFETFQDALKNDPRAPGHLPLDREGEVVLSRQH